ncbi:MAG TPA: LytTR family DNA-binding domain-containing protein [Chitinophagaceae bacterium]|nr:LytTR family DNA-binding domain-containing protein [Chitinophagaceae bacterium]
MKIKCIIIDDEPLARKGLKSYIEKIEFLELVAVCEDAVQLKSALKIQPVDLLFLDIEMPYVTGIEFLKNISHPPKVIFTTAYEKYALTGYELDVLDYLLKPISFERFLKACNKAYDYFSSKEDSQNNISFAFVKVNGKLEKLVFNDIFFIEAMENYVGIYTTEKKMIVSSTLKSMLEKLPAGNFIQTHKSYIVAKNKINSIQGNIININHYQVPISKIYKEHIVSQLEKLNPPNRQKLI